MIETTNIMYTRTPAGVHAGNTERAAGGDYYQAYYRELVSRGASRSERNRRLEAIKTERRRARREKWLREIKSLASVLINSEAVG
ncbi:MAG TPA: hypothetical protein VGX24_05195 [Pyrinomonadaceae bacterium]|nr:hypothetical protein [Pyrinomonadaceae bacterium]